MYRIVCAARALAAAAVCSMLVAGGALAQGVTTGAITGRITDEQGQPLVGVDVQIVNRSTGYSTRTLTRANGLYLLQGLEVGGPYSVLARSIGFQPYVRDGIYVKLSEATRVDAQLSVQAVELAPIAVTVARSADFASSRQGVGTQISDTLITRVPTFSRDFIDLLKLSPQVVYPASGAASGGGAYNRFNTITVDGANQSERFNLSATGGVPGGSAGGKIVSLDAIKEFRVMFTPTDVRQGNFTGMLVNAVTKNGTNVFEGGGSITYRSNGGLNGFRLVGEELRVSEFSVHQYAFHIGGPIIRNRLHFFIAPEFQQRTAPAGGAYYLNGQPSPAPDAPSVPLDSLTRIATIMQQTYGFDVGTTGVVNNDNPLSNLFGRLDFQISPVHRLVLRQIINRADDGSFFRNTNTLQTSALNQNSGFRFGSNRFSRVGKNTSSVAQLYSNLPGGASNEFIFGYNTIRAEISVPVQAPEVGVGVNLTGPIQRAVTFGTEQFAPNNLLDQDIIELVNNFTIPLGAHTFTLGGRIDHTHIFNNFAQGTYGVYVFPNIDSLQAGGATDYAVGYANSRRPEDIPADFRVQVWSVYGQDQWAVTNRLTVTAGLRGDMPWLLDTPPNNDTLTNALAAVGLPGVYTAVRPKTRMLFSPRVGFNYNATGDSKNQIRGGVGLYAGPPPYIMLGNAYANTGLGLVRLRCSGAGTPAFTLDVTQLPKACRGLAEPGPGAAGTIGVNLTDPNFKYPQYFGMSFGFDRQLPLNTVLTVEAMYRKAINGVLVRDKNLMGPRLVGGQPYTDSNGRVLYADTILANGSVPFSRTYKNRHWLDSLRGVSFSEGLIEVTNQSKDYNYSLSLQLNRRFSDRFEATAAYTYMKSEDVQSLTSDRAISNWRNGRQLSTSHDDLQTTTSIFSRPHRLVLYGTYTFPSQLTALTLYYERSSGVPFTYVASGDLNGDLYNGNDPLYIPRSAIDTSEIKIGTGVNGTGTFAPNAAAAQAFDRFISAQPCLNDQRGSIMERNSCRSPAQDRLDVSIRQSIPKFMGQQLSVQLDFFNFLNFLNKDWGQIKLPTLSPTFNDQRALIQTGRNNTDTALPNDPASMPTWTFDTRLYNAATGAPRPFDGRGTSTARAYNIQLTLKYSF